MLSRFFKKFGAKFGFLFEKEMPVWLTIMASLAAAGATYVFAPSYSHRFQIEDVRNAHLKDTTEHLNEAIVELSQKARRFDTALANNDKKSLELHEECLDLVTKIQWQLVDLKAVLSSSSDSIEVDRLSNAVDRLRISLNSPASADYRSHLRTSMGVLAAATVDVLQKLYEKSSLKD